MTHSIYNSIFNLRADIIITINKLSNYKILFRNFIIYSWFTTPRTRSSKFYININHKKKKRRRRRWKKDNLLPFIILILSLPPLSNDRSNSIFINNRATTIIPFPLIDRLSRERKTHLEGRHPRRDGQSRATIANYPRGAGEISGVDARWVGHGNAWSLAFGQAIKCELIQR